MKKALPVLFWLIVWQFVSMLVSNEILLVSPITAVSRAITLIADPTFVRTLVFSLTRILGGLFSGLILGVVLAALSYRYTLIESLLSPIVSAMKAVPVASFVILVLIWLSGRELSVVVALFVAFPIVYTNVLAGLRCADPQLIEMAVVFRMSVSGRIKGIFLPALMPHLRSACRLAIGMSWKSGIAAELIGIPRGSVGERLYQAKVYLETPDLFAWTLIIVLMSLLCEKFILFCLNRICPQSLEVRP